MLVCQQARPDRGLLDITSSGAARVACCGSSRQIFKGTHVEQDE